MRFNLFQFCRYKQKKTQKQTKIFHFIPRRNKDNTGKFLPNAPTTSLSHPSLLFGGSDLEEPINKPTEIYEDPITEEEQENIPFKTMAKNKNGREDEDKIEGAFNLQETNGDMKMKNISP